MVTRSEKQATIDQHKADDIQRDKNKAAEKEKEEMAAIATTAEAVRVAKATAAAKVDQEAKEQEEKGNPNQELKRKEEERKQTVQSTAEQDKKNKEEEEQKNGMADKTEQSSNLYLSPRHPPVKRSSYSPSLVSSVDTQEEGRNSNLVGPPKISKKLETDFEAAIDDIV